MYVQAVAEVSVSEWIGAIGVVTPVVALLLAAYRQLRAARNEETERHARLDAAIDKVDKDNVRAHAETASASRHISEDLRQHRNEVKDFLGEQRAENKENRRAHAVIFERLGHLEGWVHGKERSKHE